MNTHTPLTREQIEGLKVGDTVLNIYGGESQITDIFARGLDLKGKLFVCYYETNGKGTWSGSLKEGEVPYVMPQFKYRLEVKA